MRFIQPIAQIDQFTAFTAERTPWRAIIPFEYFFAGGAADLPLTVRCHGVREYNNSEKR